MTKLEKLLASHPIRKKPYNAIKLSRVDGNGTPLYKIAGGSGEFGAAQALKMAFERFGAHCFHCKIWMPPQALSQNCTRDHLRPRVAGGQDHLHNLVFACGPCNRSKGGTDLISFRAEVGLEYMKALDAHIARCLGALGGSSSVHEKQ